MSGSSKLAGILIENSLITDRIAHSIVGIGLNVNQEVFPSDLPNAVSMRQVTHRHYDLESLLNDLVQSIAEEIELVKRAEFETLRCNYIDRMYRRNKPHMFRVPGGEPFVAQIEGTTDNGLLILRHEDDSLVSYAFKEVEYL